MLLIDEDVAALDEVLTLAVMRATRHMVEDTRETSFKEDEGIESAGDMTSKGWLEGHGVIIHDDGVLTYVCAKA
jgi:ABC-type uncharacterized transport system ATPase component